MTCVLLRCFALMDEMKTCCPKLDSCPVYQYQSFVKSCTQNWSIALLHATPVQNGSGAKPVI